MKVGAGIFWLLVVVLFGAAAYFAVEVHRMKEATAREAAMKEAAAAEDGEGGAGGEGVGP